MGREGRGKGESFDYNIHSGWLENRAWVER